MDTKTQNTNIPPEILENLRPYKQHIERLCLECGYHGLMGVIEVKTPWYASVWFSFLLMLVIAFFLLINLNFWIVLLVSFFFGGAIGLIRKNTSRVVTMCPCCKQEIID